MIKLNTPLSSIDGVGPKFSKKLLNLEIKTVRDLLWHFPTRYEDFSQIYDIASLAPGQQATIQGTIQKISVKKTWRRRMFITEAEIADHSGAIRAVWFNQPYIRNVLREGLLTNFAGKVSSRDTEMYLSNPTYEVTHGGETKHTGRLVPIYPETRGLTSKGLRFLIKPILDRTEKMPEFIPKQILNTFRLPEINLALKKIHFPEEIEEALQAKKRFIFNDLFLLQLYNIRQKQKLAEHKASPLKADLEFIKNILSKLPFELTLAQKKSLWEIIKDLEKPSPMNRLLQGDVGSGKTVVAALAAIIAAKNNHQTAFMAPTEVLASQHFETLRKLFLGLEQNINLGFISSGGAKIFWSDDLGSNVKKTDLAKKIDKNEIQVVIGTHALIEKNLKFSQLGLVVIDEQHRFGVVQRAALLKQTNGLLPHLLSMSATPIPRTLSLTVFGDLDLSIIDELPKGRKNIVTKVVPPINRNKAYDFIRNEIKAGRQAFVICPRIEPEEKNGELYEDKRKMAWAEIKTVKEEAAKLSAGVFPDLKIAMLHGKMPAKGGSASGGKSKEEIMKDFKEGKFDILVSTSVIEVGVDVPNATIMVVEGADRFGLAQLYQFRGRVGRGEHQSFCFLFTDSPAKSTAERLTALLTAKNGFELAEKDLTIRGPGEFLGQNQTGLPDITMRALSDGALIKEARFAAEKIISESRGLEKYPALLQKINEFKNQIHQE